VEAVRKQQPGPKQLYILPARLLYVNPASCAASSPASPPATPPQSLAIQGAGAAGPSSSMSAWPAGPRMGSAREACAPSTATWSPSGSSSRVLLGAAGS